MPVRPSTAASPTRHRGASVRALAAWTLVLATALPATAQDPMIGDASIRIEALRAESNAALEAGDVTTFMASIDGDYVGTAGDGGHIRSRDELATLIRGMAVSPVGLYFVRTTEEIEVSPDGRRAVEAGRWEGRERSTGDAIVTRAGRYTAYWRRVEGRWVIHAEIFVTLGSG